MASPELASGAWISASTLALSSVRFTETATDNDEDDEDHIFDDDKDKDDNGDDDDKRPPSYCPP